MVPSTARWHCILGKRLRPSQYVNGRNVTKSLQTVLVCGIMIFASVWSGAFLVGRAMPQSSRSSMPEQATVAKVVAMPLVSRHHTHRTRWVGEFVSASLGLAGSSARSSDTTLAAEGSVLGKLKRRLAEEKNPGANFWEMELETRLVDMGSGLEVCEATQPDHIMGAADLLASWNKGENGSDGFMDSLQPLAGLGYMRLLSSVSLQTPLTVVAVAENEGVVGMAEVKKDGYVRNLIVRADWSRRGVGTRLLCWCARKSRERGASELWMHVSVDNHQGIAFYRNLNFTFGAEEIYGPQQELGARLSRKL